MVFQQPNPFAMSIFRNVAFGLAPQSLQGSGRREGRTGAAPGRAVGRGQGQTPHQRDSRSRADSSSGYASRAPIATEPAVLLMDEPCSALDPIATRQIEELMTELKKKYTIAIVTHNLQQAKRVADMTAFLYVDTTAGGRTGYQVEYGPTQCAVRESQGRAYPGIYARRVQLRAFFSRHPPPARCGFARALSKPG